MANPALAYAQVPYEAAAQEMLKSGLSPDAARLMNELMRSINEGIYKATETRSEANTTPTSIARFAEEIFLPVYRA